MPTTPQLPKKEINMYGSYEAAIIYPAVNSYLSHDNAGNEMMTHQDIIDLKEHLVKVLESELNTQRQEILEEVEKEVIGENEPPDTFNGYQLSDQFHIEMRNNLRKKQREKLAILKKKGEG